MSVYKRKWTGKSGRVRTKWMVHIKFKQADGGSRVIRRVSPVNTKRGAQAYERELREQLLPGLHGKDETGTDTQNSTNTQNNTNTTVPLEVPTLGEFAEEFLAYQATLNKPTEIHAKRSILEHHLIPAFGDVCLDQIDVRAIDRYKVGKRSVLDHGGTLKPKTVNNHLKVLSRLLRVACKWNLIDRVPQIELLRVPAQPFDFLDFGETERFLAAAREHEPRWYPYLLVSIRTGLRVGEMLALRKTDVRLGKRQLRVELSYTKVGGVGSPKSGKAREVPLTWDAIEALEEQRQQWAKGPLMFPSQEGEVGSSASVGHFVSKVAKHAGLRHVHPHMLRHSFASQAVMRGVPIRVVQEWLGHADITMTMRYAHLAEGIGHELIGRLAPEKAAQPKTAPGKTAPKTRSTIGAQGPGRDPQSPPQHH